MTLDCPLAFHLKASARGRNEPFKALMIERHLQMAQDVTSLLRTIESESKGQLTAYASLVLSLEKRFILFFGFIRTENADSLF